MKLAFWSARSGLGHTTSHMLAIAHTLAICNGVKGLIMHSIVGDDSAEKALFRESARINGEQFAEVGISALMMRLKAARAVPGVFDSCSVPVIKDKLYLLPGADGKQGLICDNNYWLTASLPKLAANEYAAVYVDVGSVKDSVQSALTEDADIVVVNCNQDRAVLENSLAAGFGDRAFYLIGDYSADSRYNITNLRKLYKELGNDNSAVIPFCSEYRDAASEGCITGFMQHSLSANRDYSAYNFIRCVKEASDKLKKQMERTKQI